jgi:hypothetical protein
LSRPGDPQNLFYFTELPNNVGLFFKGLTGQHEKSNNYNIILCNVFRFGGYGPELA